MELANQSLSRARNEYQDGDMALKMKVIGYWTTAAMLVFGVLSGGIAELAHLRDNVEGIVQLGYPVYFVAILGFWRVLGGIAWLVPRFPRLKEWAYAGIFFNMTGAAAVCRDAALDMLRSRTSRREDSLSAQLTEPVARSESATDPEQEALLADSVGLALLVVLDRLTPAERLAFVLHDLFGVSFDEIATIVGRIPGCGQATRQPRTSPCAGRSQDPRRRPQSTAGGCRRFSRCLARGRRRRTSRGARPQTSWSASTRLGYVLAHRGRSAGRRTGRRGRSLSHSLPGLRDRRSSTVAWDLSLLQADASSGCSSSRSRAGRSLKSTWSPTPRGYESSILRFSMTDPIFRNG